MNLTMIEEKRKRKKNIDSTFNLITIKFTTK